MISFACPACSKQFNVNDELTGTRDKCPACGEPITIPEDLVGGTRSAQALGPHGWALLASAVMLLIAITLVGAVVLVVNRVGKEKAHAAAVSNPPAAMPIPPLDPGWVKKVQSLAVDKQAAEVGAELKRRNPDFDGKVKSTESTRAVTSLQFSTDNVTDISPVRALPDLEVLACHGSNVNKGKLTNLSPLAGMKLKELVAPFNPLVDLRPLENMPLKSLDLAFTMAKDITPLKGAPLTYLDIAASNVNDLAPLKGAPLETLIADHCPIKDLSPLQGMALHQLALNTASVEDLSSLRGCSITDLRVGHFAGTDLGPLRDVRGLKKLTIYNTRVTDLTPLKGLLLDYLDLRDTRIANISPIKDLPLVDVLLDFKPAQDEKVLRAMKPLQSINGEPVAEFWKLVAANNNNR